MQVKIDSEFRDLIPPLATEELVALEFSLLEEGCRDALVVWEGTLVDGHNRHAICERHNIEYRTVEREFTDRRAVRVWIRNNQLSRRNLSDAWRIELALQNKADLAEIGAEKHKATVGRPSKEKSLSQADNDLPKHNTQKEIAKTAGVATGTIGKAEVVRKEAPELWEKAKAGKLTVNAAYQKAKKEIKAERDKRDLAAAQKTISTAKRQSIESVCDLRVCSCAELFASGIKPDVVITDPPYPQEFLPVFTELAEGCKAAGVPLVAVMSGQSYLPEVMRRLCEHLRYRWMLAYMTPGGQAVQQWQAKVNTSWKPVILFGDAVEWFGDVAVSKPNDNEKRFHDWGQSLSGMADLVERLTKPGQLVCDPFLGAGSTAVASLKLGRRFVGCDVDAACVQQAREWVSA